MTDSSFAFSTPFPPSPLPQVQLTSEGHRFELAYVFYFPHSAGPLVLGMHLRAQPASGAEGWLCALLLLCVPLYKGLEHLWTLVLGILEPIPVDT